MQNRRRIIDKFLEIAPSLYGDEIDEVMEAINLGCNKDIIGQWVFKRVERR